MRTWATVACTLAVGLVFMGTTAGTAQAGPVDQDRRPASTAWHEEPAPTSWGAARLQQALASCAEQGWGEYLYLRERRPDVTIAYSGCYFVGDGEAQKLRWTRELSIT